MGVPGYTQVSVFHTATSKSRPHFLISFLTAARILSLKDAFEMK